MGPALTAWQGPDRHARFAAMCAHYLFDPDFCNVASGWERGVVEKNVQDSRRRVWIDAGNQRFGSFIELNAWLGQRCRALWDEVRHPEFDGYVEKPARVSSTRLVSVARNRYQKPAVLDIRAGRADEANRGAGATHFSGVTQTTPILLSPIPRGVRNGDR